MEQTITDRSIPEVQADPRRYWILLTLCLSLIIIGLDNLILNVALPSIQHDLNASASDLQWTVDGYSLIFAALLLTTGSLGDRFGRKLALNIGLLCFGVGSVGAALSASIGQLIGLRVLMGLGAALIMPSTLSIITNVFPANERGRAISIWAGVAALGIPLGPVLGGILLEHYSWGSVFFINIPIVLIAILVGWFIVPESRDPQGTPPDVLGVILSIGGLVALVYGIIEAPQKGWTSQTSLISWGIAVVLLGAFLAWQLRAPHPMLPLTFFRNRQFDGAILGILLLGFILFGTFFMLTQYLQYVRGYTPLDAGLRLLPIATLIIGTQSGVRLTERLGLKVILPSGMVLVTVGVYLLSRLTTTSSDGQLLWTLALIGFAMGNVLAPSATAILGGVPVERAGIGSAMTTVGQQLGGALGVAVLGSVLNTNYSSNINATAMQLPPQAPASIVTGSLNGALAVAQHIGGPVGSQLAAAARSAYTDGMSGALVAAAIIAIAGAVFVAVVLPRQSQVMQQQPLAAPQEEVTAHPVV